MLLAYSQYEADGAPIWGNHDALLGWSLARDLVGCEAAKPADAQVRWQGLVHKGGPETPDPECA